MRVQGDVLRDYQSFEFVHDRWQRSVFRRGDGPAVIVIHEMPGLHPLVVRFADRLAAAGTTVFLPSLFGTPGKPVSVGYAVAQMLGGICIRREFSVWATDRSSPIVDWLRALARHAFDACGGAGVGALGMCFTGGFALAMLTEPVVVAPVLSQPSLPLAMGPGKRARAAAIDASPEELACARRRLDAEGLKMLALRFRGDPFVPDARFEFLARALGENFVAVELRPEDAAGDARPPPHSVLTIHLDDGDPDGPTRRAERQVIEFFITRLIG